MLSFKQLATHSSIYDQNDFFIHYFNPDARFRYDSNVFQLLFSPVRVEFELIEEMNSQFSFDFGLSHIKFYWPENQGIYPDTLAYLNESDYGLEKLELYAILPEYFKAGPVDPLIRISNVSKELLDSFKAINYIEDLTISTAFAEHKQSFYDQLFSQSNVSFLMATINNDPVGSTIIIEGEDTIEIDDLFTLPNFRKRGVATALQQAVMQRAHHEHKTVILAADAEDSPKLMYQKQGYDYISFRIGVQKKIEEGFEWPLQQDN